MNLVDRCGPIVAALVGGVLAAFALRESEVLDHTIAAKDGLSGVLVTPQWAGTIAAVVAVAALTVLLRLRSGIGAAATALVGAAAIGLPAVVAVATEPALTLNAVGAGLMLGAAAYPTAGRRAPLIALALGVLAATVFFGGALTPVLGHAESSTCWGSEMIFSHVTQELLGRVPAPGGRVVRV
ncbi:MAG: hypothetical protein WAW17_13765, partial [Rhodococcus sp. (in: high G+C Gram-positive bacteria)]